ncbi:MAG: oxygenase MpaB family protein [Chloroflexota bacterium]
MIAQRKQATTSQFYFDEMSAIWHINRERVLLLTGAKVLLMQIAHPMVATAVREHSYVFNKPLLRLHRTLTLTLGMVFGTQDEVHQSIAEIEKAHRPATGRIKETIGKHQAGAVYNPRAPRQALWVFATLVEGAISGYETLVEPLSQARKDEFYANSAKIADWMGIPESYLPNNYTALCDYMTDAIASQEIIVGEDARAIAPFITTQSIPVLKWLSYPAIRLNVALLPDTIQEQYGYRIGQRERLWIDRTFALSRRITPRLPHLIRFAPEYHRAMRLKQNS